MKKKCVWTQACVDIDIYAFLILKTDGDEWSVSHPGHFSPRETAAGTHWILRRVVPRDSLHMNLCPSEEQTPILQSSSPQPSHYTAWTMLPPVIL
jgi:hypothetical protein